MGRLPDPGVTRATERELGRRQRRFQLPRFARILSPRYTPHPRPEPEAVREQLARYEA